MERPRFQVPWLRRGLEAGIFGGILSGATLIAYHLSRPEPRLVLPTGIDGAMILTPAVLALGVFAISYPAFLAATRADAVLGAVAAYLIGADLLMVASLIIGDSILVHSLSRALPLGMVAAVLAIPVGLAGMLVGQLTPLGFGRSTAFRSAATSLALSIIAVLAAARFV